ncbi:MAG TPA: AAA family ATPase [Alphaproteobacteria bacterium]|nr:AAA family ATPase [Alphaproteobacteria bacterium]
MAQSQKSAAAQQFPPEKLRYCPTDDFLNLRHRERLTETTSIDFRFISGVAHEHERVADVKLTRGRNGVVKATVMGDPQLQATISDPKKFFSIYVPGLAGISIREEYRSDLVVNNGIARGDANLYLRNVLLRIQRDAIKRAKFSKLLEIVFPGHTVHTKFDNDNDLWIAAEVGLPDGRLRPLDTSGTGFLQAVQLIAYITNYSPQLLLLDEPDAHLHPNNQKLLAQTLSAIVEENEVQVILATHSRHLLDALSTISGSVLYSANDGALTKRENWGDMSILMDLGALDKSELFLAGNYRYLVWTEDAEQKYLTSLLAGNGFPLEQTMVFSYKTSSKIDAAAMMASFVSRIRPGVKLIIHRDRDFMTDAEVERLKQKYTHLQNAAISIMLTKFSDVEAYFSQPEHLCERAGMLLEEAQALLDDVIRELNNELVLKFRDKREQVKRDLYKTDPDNCPDTVSLIPAGQLLFSHSLGKSLMKKVNARIQAKGLNPNILIAPSAALFDAEIRALL